jgi:hypothetical protein
MQKFPATLAPSSWIEGVRELENDVIGWPFLELHRQLGNRRD